MAIGKRSKRVCARSMRSNLNEFPIGHGLDLTCSHPIHDKWGGENVPRSRRWARLNSTRRPADNGRRRRVSMSGGLQQLLAKLAGVIHYRYPRTVFFR